MANRIIRKKNDTDFSFVTRNGINICPIWVQGDPIRKDGWYIQVDNNGSKKVSKKLLSSKKILRANDYHENMKEAFKYYSEKLLKI